MDSLDNYLATNNYIDNVIMPDANTVAGELLAVIEANPSSLTLVGVSTMLVEGYIIGVGLNTIEYWGTALGTAAGEAVYD